MKTLQERTKRIYRFRCDRCSSKFEITEDEKLEIDRKFDRGTASQKADPNRMPHNYPWNFDCPVCNAVRLGGRASCIDVMNDGTEVVLYHDGRM